MASLTLDDFGGGVNTGQPPSRLKPSELADLLNFYPYGRKLIRRGGFRRVNTIANSSTEYLTGIIQYEPVDVSTLRFVVGHETGLQAYSSAGAFANIPAGAGIALTASKIPWIFFIYKEILYAFRRGSDVLLRSDGTYFGRAGISAPTAAPTLADAGAGSIPDADFVGVYTYYNTNTGIESNPSPASATVTLGGGTSTITWTGITTSTDPQVNARRLYRSFPDQDGEYYLIATISDNTSTGYVGDNTLVADFGDPASYNNGLPPDDPLFGDIWKERSWLSDGTDVFVSEVGLPECFADEDSGGVIKVKPDDGFSVTGIRAWGDRVVIAKSGAMYYIVGTDPDNFDVRVLSDRHGCDSHHSLKVAEGLLFWKGADDVYMSNGGPPQPIGTPRIKSFLDELDPNSREYITAAVDPRRGWYILILPSAEVLHGGFQPRDTPWNNLKYLVYNYRTDGWTVFSSENQSPGILANVTDEDNQPFLYGVIRNSIIHFDDPDYGFDDKPHSSADPSDSQLITATLQTAEFDFGAPGDKSVLRRLHVLSPQVAATFSARFLRERETSPPAYRTGMDLDRDEAWKAYALSNLERASSGSRLDLSYEAEPVLEIEALRLDYELIQGRFQRAR